MFVFPFSYGSKDQYPLISAAHRAKNSEEKCPYTNIIDISFRLIIANMKQKADRPFITTAVSKKNVPFKKMLSISLLTKRLI